MSAPLPQIVQELIDVAGGDAAWAIVRAWSGRHVYIPPEAPDGHWLVQLVGRGAADAVCQRYRDPTAEGGFIGRRILIPMVGTGHYKEAWRRVLSDPNLSLRDVAAIMGVHERTVSYRRAKIGKTDDRQKKLL